MQIVPDTNIIHELNNNCHRIRDKGRRISCLERQKKIESIMEGKGCTLVPGFLEEELRYRNVSSKNGKYVIFTYDVDGKKIAAVCDSKKLSSSEREFVERFVSRLAEEAIDNQRFFVACTQEARQNEPKMEAIRRSMRHDWKAVASSMLIEDDVRLLSYDRDVTDEYCKSVYVSAAKHVGGAKANSWDAVRP
ncbi:hypothetical protein DRP07_00140 [Archaeoglobales archaeon]|nr:MAG: hypothetical protein DRP07_00140 [Archaeoglobales archaeon]